MTRAHLMFIYWTLFWYHFRHLSIYGVAAGYTILMLPFLLGLSSLAAVVLIAAAGAVLMGVSVVAMIAHATPVCDLCGNRRGKLMSRTTVEQRLATVNRDHRRVTVARVPNIFLVLIGAVILAWWPIVSNVNHSVAVIALYAQMASTWMWAHEEHRHDYGRLWCQRCARIRWPFARRQRVKEDA